jgi:glycosyltransferase involved in cell wall biosynthesis
MGDVPERLVMPKILYLDSSVGIFGGGQISLLEFLANIDRAKYEPLVVVGEEGKLKNEIEKLGVECQVIPMPSFKKLNPFLSLAGFCRVFNYARKRKAKIIHCNTSRAALYAGPAAKILGISLIWHVRIPHSDNLLDRLLVPLCSRIIAVSQVVKGRFDRFKKAKVEVVYNGVDIKAFLPGSVKKDVKNKLQIRSEDIVIGTVGRLSPEKGFEYLLTAIRDVINVYPSVKVFVAGNGNEKYRLYLQERINELKLSSNIIFTGFYEDVPQILRCMDIYCLPSLSEGFSRSLLEAMASGLPVIATSVGGNMEVIQDGVNGLLVPSSNPVRLASAIKELLKDKEKARRMGLAGRELVVEKFSVEKNVIRTEAVYEEMILKK